VLEQQRAIAIKDISAGTEIPGRSAADMWSPHAGDGWPIKPLFGIFRVIFML